MAKHELSREKEAKVEHKLEPESKTVHEKITESRAEAKKEPVLEKRFIISFPGTNPDIVRKEMSVKTVKLVDNVQQFESREENVNFISDIPTVTISVPINTIIRVELTHINKNNDRLPTYTLDFDSGSGLALQPSPLSVEMIGV